MKSNTFGLLGLILALAFSCQTPTGDNPLPGGNPPQDPPPPPPVADTTGPQISSPSLSAASLPDDKPLTVTAQVTDSQSDIQGVQLYNQDTVLGTFSLKAPGSFALTLSKVPAGTYTGLKVRAVDTAGNITWSTLPQFKSLSTNALLSKIVVKNTSNGATFALSPSFSPTVYKYTVTVNTLTLTITPTKADPNAAGQSTQTDTGTRQKTCKITITAEAGAAYTKTYTVIVNY